MRKFRLYECDSRRVTLCFFAFKLVEIGILHKQTEKTLNLLNKLSLKVAVIVNLICINYTIFNFKGQKGKNKD